MASSVHEMLPSWYPLRKVGGEVSLDILLEIGKKRIDFLLSVKDTHYKEVDTNHDVVLGNISLCIVAAISGDAYFTNWLLETEGDVFEHFFARSDSTEKMAILRDVLGEVIVGLAEIAEKINMSTEKIVGYLSTIKRVRKRAMFQLLSTFQEYNIAMARFERAYRIIKKERGILIRGWVIAPLAEFFSAIKSYYQDKLKERIQKIRERISQQVDKVPYEEFARELLTYWRNKRAIRMPKRDSFIFFGKDVWQKPELFPPCSRILFDRFLTTGYIPHGERVQLALFLKAIGMPLEEQLKFWYRAVDNVGLSWDEFLKKGGYYIRHIYGLEGSRKNYNAPKCDTIISKYFCPFSRISVSELGGVLRNINKNITREYLDEIRDLCISREYKKACAVFLRSLIGENKGIRIYEIRHPVQFVRLVRKYSRNLKVRKHEGEISKNL